MSNPQDCWEKLRELAETGSGDPRKDVAKIVRKFASGAAKSDVRQLKMRLADTLTAGQYTTVPLSYLDQHNRWLAVLASACTEMKEGR